MPTELIPTKKLKEHLDYLKDLSKMDSPEKYEADILKLESELAIRKFFPSLGDIAKLDC
jgi:hypothetical protein